MHPIQRHILRELMFHPERRFSDLKPLDTDPTLFMYHFRKLLGAELVEKRDGGYVLTSEGIRYAGRVRSTSIELRTQPTVFTALICRDEQGRWLLHTRAYQPFLGLKGFPYGKIHWGETLYAAAERELENKTGLRAKLLYVGCLNARVWSGDELLQHMLYHVFRGSSSSGETLVDGNKGACCWEKVTDPTDAAYMPGFSELMAMANTAPGNVHEADIHLL